MLSLLLGLPMLSSVVPAAKAVTTQPPAQLTRTFTQAETVPQTRMLMLTEPAPTVPTEPETVPTDPTIPPPTHRIGAVEPDYFDDALFVGDSLTYGLQAYNIIPQASFAASIGVNLGTMHSPGLVTLPNGNTVSMMQAIALQPDPGKVYIMMGTNGINWMSVSGMIDHFDNLIDYIRECFPETIIYVQSILPAASFVPERQPGIAPWKIGEYNAALKELAESRDAFFLDIHSIFADTHGYLPQGLAAPDGIHIGSTSYQNWYQHLMENAVIK